MEPIAIVGISAQLPGGHYSKKDLDYQTFFQFLLDGGEAFEKIPSKRFNIAAWQGSHLAHIDVDTGTFLKDIDVFDNVEFGVSSKDATIMAPVTKRLLENSFLALLDSGIDYRARNVGCFASGDQVDFIGVCDPDEYLATGSFAGHPCMVANRISTHLDLLGPSIPTDTACSSTLSAFHLAVQAVAHGECEAAVVAGCQLDHRFVDWFTYSQASLLAKDGKCKPFDASADGFSRGEGCVAVVIKPLADAIRDHDRIYATVLGTAINSSGGAAPPGAPVAEAQREAMVQAFKRAGKRPQDVDFVELHATGTAKGDPTEANWVGEEFHRDDELIVGSVKGNIGHAEIVAFLASLSKVLMTVQTNTIPPQANLRTLNPAIHWDQYRMRAPLEPMPLPCRGERPLIAMSSSGIGGSNGHVVLEGPPPAQALGSAQVTGPVLLMAAGLSSRSASVIGESLRDLLATGSVDLHALSTVMGRRAKQMTYRCYAIVDPASPDKLSFSAPQHCARAKNPVVVLFSGQGPQHIEMGRELFAKFPVFRNSILEMDEVFKRVIGKSAIHDYGLFGEKASSALEGTWPISVILPSIAVFQMAFFDLLVSLGVKPDIVLGHSAGETAVLYASGAAPKAMAVELALLRGRVFTSVESLGGTMAAVSCGPEEAQSLIDQVRQQDVLEIACYNSPTAVAVAGHEVAIDRLVDLAQAQGRFCRKIRTRVPIHSSMMEHCKTEYVNGLRDLFKRYPGDHVPQIVSYSTLNGSVFEGRFEADYFWQTTRNPVRFTQAMEAITASSPSTIIEVSPHPVLSSYVSQIIQDVGSVFASTRRAKQGQPSLEYHDVLELCAKLTAAGHNSVDFTALNGRACHELKDSLPEYPLVKKTFALYPDSPGYAKQMEPRNGPLNHPYLKMNKETHPLLAEHIIRGEPIMPAAGFMEMALEFGATALIDVNLRSILSLSSERPTKVDVVLDGSRWTIKTKVSSKHGNISSAGTERVHADGYLSFEPSPAGEMMDIPAIRQRCQNHIGSSFYEQLEYFSAYGPHFRRVTNVYYGHREALVSIKGTDIALKRDGRYLLHPAILDACLHVTALKAFHGDFNPNSYYLPAHADAVILHRPSRADYFPSHIYAHVVLKEWTPSSLFYDMKLVDDLGAPLCTLQRLEAAKHRMDAPQEATNPFGVILQSAIVSPPSSIEKLDISKCPIDRVAQNGYVVQGDMSGLLALRHAEEVKAALEATKGKRIVRLLLECADDSALEPLATVLQQYSALFLEAFVTDERHRRALNLSANSGTVRVLERDSLPTAWFDLISVFDLDSSAQDAVAKLGKSLLPGGSFVLTTGGVSTVAGSPQKTKVNALAGTLQDARLSVQHASLTQAGDLFGLTVKSQHGPHSDIYHPLFDAEESFIFHYTHGQEEDLQWGLSGLDPSAPEDVWVLANDGPDGRAAVGLVRALRREYLLWNIHLVVFPVHYDEDSREDYIKTIPSYMEDEPDMVVDVQGDLLVPRMAPLPPVQGSQKSVAKGLSDAGTHDDILAIQVRSSYRESVLTGIFGSEGGGHGEHEAAGHPVVALVPDLPETFVRVDRRLGSYLSARLEQYGPVVAASVAGLVTAVLAQGIHTIGVPERVKSLKVLVTHSDTIVGTCVRRMYVSQGISVVGIPANATLLQLADMRRLGKFSLVVTGFKDNAYLQVAHTLLSPDDGKVFVWADEQGDLMTLLRKDPWSVSDALRVAVSFLDKHITELHAEVRPLLDAQVRREGTPLALSAVNDKSGSSGISAVLDPNKTYLLLGGVGSIGAHIALLFYQRGARHIVLTSRRGAEGLKTNANGIVRRIFEYLSAQEGLDIRLETADASSLSSMQALLGRLHVPLGGCILLSAVLHDRTFQHTRKAEFDQVIAAKVGALDTLRAVTDISSMDFVIGFSSVVGLFGNAGQTSYGAANTALEGQLSQYTNAFTFVCPGIIDTTLMLAGKDQSEITHLNQFAGWSITTEDMLLWLEDAICRFQCGERVSRYLPNLNWQALDRTLGMPVVGKHLLSEEMMDTIASTDDVESRMADMIRGVLSIPANDFSPDTPFTVYGIDSLSAARLSFLLRPIVEVSQLQLLADMTLNDLLAKLAGAEADEGVQDKKKLVHGDKEGLMQALLDKYMQGLDAQKLSHPVPETLQAPIDHVVVVSGTTGTLGCNILSHLLQKEDVKQVYAINRKDVQGRALRDRQRSALETQGFPTSLLESPKLTLMECDLQRADLGVDAAMLDQMLSQATHIIHNAWRVDLYSDLNAFEDLIASTRTLIDFATRSKLPTRPSFSFVSTVAIYRHPHDASRPVPEEPILEPGVAKDTGYSESKWVAERLTQIAAEKASLRTQVIRTGLLSGGVNGFWDVNHWFPAITQSAVFLGCLPEGDEDIFWLPMDVAAAAIADFRNGPTGTFQLNHPRPVKWSTVMKPLAAIMGVPLVPYVEWFARLNSLTGEDLVGEASGGVSVRLPGAALKLRDFFGLGATKREHTLGTESMGLLPRAEMDKGLRASATLADEALPQLGEKDVRNWVAYWQDVGFLPASVNVL